MPNSEYDKIIADLSGIESRLYAEHPELEDLYDSLVTIEDTLYEAREELDENKVDNFDEEHPEQDSVNEILNCLQNLMDAIEELHTTLEINK